MPKPTGAIDLQPVRRLLARHLEHEAPYQVDIDSLRLTLLPGVFCPAYTQTSSFLARHVQVNEGEHVLDMFGGSGYQGLMTARRAASVTCVDWSVEATRCAEINARMNGLADRVTVLLGDLFSAVTGHYDVVVANPPLLPGQPENILETAVLDDGLDHTRRFVEEVRDYLSPTGRAYILTTDAHTGMGIFDIAQCSAANDLTCRTVATRVLSYETYTVHELRPRRAA